METPLRLLERLRTAPDEAAWPRLDDIYRPLVGRWLLHWQSLQGEIEDVVQDVLTVLIRELPTFERERKGSFRSWLCTITAHRALAYHRSLQRQPQAVALPWRRVR